MSHATGQVIKGTTNNYYFLYDGYNAMPKLFESSDLAWDQWDEYTDEAYTVPSCSHPKVTVELFVDYGSGLKWHSNICETCKLITGSTEPCWG